MNTFFLYEMRSLHDECIGSWSETATISGSQDRILMKYQT